MGLLSFYASHPQPLLCLEAPFWVPGWVPSLARGGVGRDRLSRLPDLLPVETASFSAMLTCLSTGHIYILVTSLHWWRHYIGDVVRLQAVHGY